MRTMTSRVSPKGQVTIPIEIRKALGLGPKDRVRFTRDEHGVHIEKYESVLDKYFMYAPALNPPRTWKEIEAEVRDERAERFARQLASLDDEE
ncbi:MAG TPA: AbrB/MazE/SpoVT family DNA-binding domain-containing protein [Dehalococcoidia bacterium]|nr:AbrB/MazE/SpoVT family DNA-binding domain-containing protein [Dehalococcoidia bacterium]